MQTLQAAIEEVKLRQTHQDLQLCSFLWRVESGGGRARTAALDILVSLGAALPGQRHGHVAFVLGTGVRKIPQGPRKVAPYFMDLGILIMLTPGVEGKLRGFLFLQILTRVSKTPRRSSLSGLPVTSSSVACAVKAKTPQGARSGWFLFLQVFLPLISQSFPCFLKARWGCLWCSLWWRGHNLFWIVLKGVQLCIKLV